MAQARRRVARALGTVRRIPGTAQARRAPGARPEHDAPPTAALVRVSVALEEIGRWLEEFHPHALVELDYGGVGQLPHYDPLPPGQAVAEGTAAVSGPGSREVGPCCSIYR